MVAEATRGEEGWPSVVEVTRVVGYLRPLRRRSDHQRSAFPRLHDVVMMAVRAVTTGLLVVHSEAHRREAAREHRRALDEVNAGPEAMG